MGLELGQSNAAWMMERAYGHAGPNAASVAYSLYRRSAEQGNVASLLLMGDSYFYGQVRSGACLTTCLPLCCGPFLLTSAIRCRQTAQQLAARCSVCTTR